MPGWQTPPTNARTYSDPPKAARDYIGVSIFTWAGKTSIAAEPSSTLRSLSESSYVACILTCAAIAEVQWVKYIGTGPDRDAMIQRP